VSYWLRQQDVQRGGQPWYYYLLLLPLYEFLPLLVGTAGGVWYLARRVRDNRLQMADDRQQTADGRGQTADDSRQTTDSARLDRVDHRQPPALQRYFVALLIYWAIDVLFIYSWAGEKMP
jgi:hypothetical protein